MDEDETKRVCVLQTCFEHWRLVRTVATDLACIGEVGRGGSRKVSWIAGGKRQAGPVTNNREAKARRLISPFSHTQLSHVKRAARGREMQRQAIVRKVDGALLCLMECLYYPSLLSLEPLLIYQSNNLPNNYTTVLGRLTGVLGTPFFIQLCTFCRFSFSRRAQIPSTATAQCYAIQSIMQLHGFEQSRFEYSRERE